MTSYAQTPAADEQRLKDYETENKIAAQRYGAGATPNTGQVTGADKLSNLASQLQLSAYDTAALEIVKALKPTMPVIVTTQKNFGQLTYAAYTARQAIYRTLDVGSGLVPGKPATCPGYVAPAKPQPGTITFGTTVPVLLAAAGAIDSIVGLFRTNYDVGSEAIAANELALTLAILRQAKANSTADGITLTSPSTKLLMCLNEVARLRRDVAATAPQKDTPGSAYIAAADAMLAAMTIPAADGTTVVGKIAEYDSFYDMGQSHGVLFVQIVAPAGTTIATKRLFSRNGKVHIIFSAAINAILEEPTTAATGPQRASTSLPVIKRTTLDLSKMSDASSILTL
ncbi:hypothetical protein [Pseudoxanthomonas wuyuanensis]